MTAKQIIALVVGIAALAITAWKGPQAWGLVASGLVAVVLFVSALKIIPKEDDEYIQDLEDALTKTQIALNLAEGKNAPNVYDGIRRARSRARFDRRVVKL